MQIQVIASSSQGNCYVLTSGETTLLLECGVGFKTIKKALNFDLSKINGCLVTHEHEDHAKAIMDVLKAGIDVYTGYLTLGTMFHHRLHNIKARNHFTIGNLYIMPFDVVHDAREPLGFLIFDKKTREKLLFVTDTSSVKYEFRGLNYIMIECNYDLKSLQNNQDISENLKSRIISYHFGLDELKRFLAKVDNKDLTNIVLIHLSSKNADPELIQREIFELTKVDTVIAEAGQTIELEKYPF